MMWCMVRVWIIRTEEGTTDSRSEEESGCLLVIATALTRYPCQIHVLMRGLSRDEAGMDHPIMSFKVSYVFLWIEIVDEHLQNWRWVNGSTTKLVYMPPSCVKASTCDLSRPDLPWPLVVAVEDVARTSLLVLCSVAWNMEMLLDLEGVWSGARSDLPVRWWAPVA